MLRHLLRFQSARGNEIRVVTTRSQSRSAWHEIPPSWFNWQTVLSIPWRSRTLINLAESRARQLAIRWRARQCREHNKRHLHLLDSQVTLANATKGRSGSFHQRHVLFRSHSAALAAHLRDVYGFCRSESNPADAPSRDHATWRLHSRVFKVAQRKLKPKLPSAPSKRRKGTASVGRAPR